MMINLTNRDLDLLIEISESNLSDPEKVVKFNEIISYVDLKNLLAYRENNGFLISYKLRMVSSIYDDFNSRKLFDSRDSYNNYYRHDFEEVKKRLDNLNYIYKIFESDLSEDEKLTCFFKIYDSIKQFKTHYTMVIMYGKDDHRLDFARDALDHFDFIMESLNLVPDERIKQAIYRGKIERFLEDNNYLENYLYAEHLIEAYIASGNCLEKDFIKMAGIDDNTMSYCKNLIKFINPVLYTKLENAIRDKNDNDIHNTITTIKRLAYGIDKGYLPDGNLFDELTFYKMVPFKETGPKFCYFLKCFITRNIGRDSRIYAIISNYLKEKGIKSIVPVEEDELIKDESLINDFQISEDVIHNIFRYMKVNYLPKILPVFDIILDKYLNGEIDFTSLDEQEKQFEKEKMESLYKNPYQLVLRKNGDI